MADYFAYGDESGTHGNPAYTIVAGFIGSPRQWKLLERSWAATLHQCSVDEFHAVDFFNRGYKSESTHNPYHNWTVERADAFLTQLVAAIVGRRSIHPIGAAIDTQAFNGYSVGERRFLTNAVLKKSGTFVSSGAPMRPPYQLAFSTFLYSAIERVPSDSNVHFYFDNNSAEEGLVREVFRHTRDVVGDRKGLWKRLDSVAFADSAKYPGLQAADLYAYLWNAMLVKRRAISEQQRATMEKILKGHEHPMDFWTKREMEQSLATLNQRQRARIGKDGS